MAYRLLADATVALHAAFIVFVVGGGFLVWRDARWALLARVAPPAPAHPRRLT
jgi:hypothetical protein